MTYQFPLQYLYPLIRLSITNIIHEESAISSHQSATLADHKLITVSGKYKLVSCRACLGQAWVWDNYEQEQTIGRTADKEENPSKLKLLRWQTVVTMFLSWSSYMYLQVRPSKI